MKKKKDNKDIPEWAQKAEDECRELLKEIRDLLVSKDLDILLDDATSTRTLNGLYIYVRKVREILEHRVNDVQNLVSRKRQTAERAEMKEFRQGILEPIWERNQELRDSFFNTLKRERGRYTKEEITEQFAEEYKLHPAHIEKVILTGHDYLSPNERLKARLISKSEAKSLNDRFYR